MRYWLYKELIRPQRNRCSDIDRILEGLLPSNLIQPCHMIMHFILMVVRLVFHKNNGHIVMNDVSSL